MRKETKLIIIILEKTKELMESEGLATRSAFDLIMPRVALSLGASDDLIKSIYQLIDNN